MKAPREIPNPRVEPIKAWERINPVDTDPSRMDATRDDELCVTDDEEEDDPDAEETT